MFDAVERFILAIVFRLLGGFILPPDRWTY